MDEYTPSMSEVEGAYVAWRLAVTDGNEDERSEEFARMLAEHDRVVAANAWDEGRLFAFRRAERISEKVMEFENPYRITEEDTNGR